MLTVAQPYISHRLWGDGDAHDNTYWTNNQTHDMARGVLPVPH